mmetsp:Transcript_50002/g.129059  ORF Transcript_50002/g.129059 Transcript_50002/m.129059 type:complete len:282 (-) Transcript_50002:446-1291(-)
MFGSTARRTLISTLVAPFIVGAATDESCQAKGGAGCFAKDSVLLQVQQSAVKTTTGNAHLCKFANPPTTPYFWDPKCIEGESIGCFADSIHQECRLCGEEPYTGVRCPPDAIVPNRLVCDFDNEPVSQYTWDATCTMGGVGCFADKKHVGCRFCGGDGVYQNISCGNQCSFPNEPRTPYFWDETCEMGMPGCRADGVHDKCRFCGMMPWHSITCPDSVQIPEGQCWFKTKQDMPHYWDDECEMGKLGCWADGIHAECRFCGKGVYAEIPCPEEEEVKKDGN